MASEGFPCPSCGFLEFSEPPGSYGICSICDWEDDGVQLANPTSGGGANSISLAESQKKILEKYPLNMDKTPDGTQRSKAWRPLSESEINSHQEEVKKAKSRWTRKGICDPECSYWMRFSFDLGTPEHGWMKVSLRDSENTSEFDASDVPMDSIEELTSALSAVLEGNGSSKSTWHIEPVVYEIRFQSTEDNLRISLVDTSDGDNILFETERSKAEIIFPIAQALSKLEGINKDGKYEGDSTWSHSFPSSSYAALNDSLEVFRKNQK